MVLNINAETLDFDKLGQTEYKTEKEQLEYVKSFVKRNYDVEINE